LRRPGASFVTLEMSHQLRGCIGSLEAHRPLAEDLIANGYSAAFRDPRFPPLSQEEYAILEIKISLLSAPEPMQFNSESDLVGQLQPGVDGLILQQGTHRGTFLPSVWEQLPDPQNFLDRLKQKAGLPGNHWSEKITMQRYRTEQFSE
ncbi:MAG: AmmeMemoRadiSam system protein A, partial [Gammaproteobacteria bacterium]|nr:AmmeMemoRadiSam system protein A [Gammaproteobacteria bacterium]MBT5372364.1 AmmeMemoRadiSam system protein A [Gammaproteobacteria bacterium]